MGIISYSDEDRIKQEVRSRYDEYRASYGSPRTQTEKWEMIDFILSPLLDRLSSWEVFEKTAQHKLDKISEIIQEEQENGT